jgi:hypothetical protein
MLRLLAQLFSRQSPREPPSPFCTYYVSAYREQLDGLARRLSNGRIVLTRFNPDRRCVEFFTSGEVLARIRVEGECCSPTTAIIATSLPTEVYDLFAAIFGQLDIRFGPLPA